jgi:hypothetical protein
MRRASTGTRSGLRHDHRLLVRRTVVRAGVLAALTASLLLSGAASAHPSAPAANAPTTTQTLTVTVTGPGFGRVTDGTPKLACDSGSTCTADYTTGTAVSLFKPADPGSVFDHWSGDCSGTGDCEVTMNQARSVTATFSLAGTHSLSVTKVGTGSGSVTSVPSGIDCGSTCSAYFSSVSAVTLTATPAAGSTFVGWGGDCSGTVCVTTMSQARSVLATFSQAAPQTLSVSKLGSGSGSVVSVPAGIDCGSTCSAQFSNGTSVTLTATAASGSSFVGWSGEGCTGTGSCVLTIDAARSVTATFSQVSTKKIT